MKKKAERFFTASSLSAAQPPRAPVSHLRQEYEAWQDLLDAQPALIEHFIALQARALAEAIVQHAPQARFVLPEEVVVELLPNGRGEIGYLPAGSREHVVGGLLDQIAHGQIGAAVRRRLLEMVQSPERAVATAAGLLRHATATHLVRNSLPAGRSVTYAAAEGEDIPSLPVPQGSEVPSALTTSADAVAEEGPAGDAGPNERGTLTVPFAPAARRFFLPQWVAFDEDDRLLMHSLGEAEACVASMQNYLGVLHAAVALAPYMVADAEYQRRRYGMLGQLVNQGRALARRETDEVIALIQQRAAAHDLNRGLGLSLPYFDDQALEMMVHNFDVIPAGRIMFVPGFMLHAAQQEQAKVAQDTRLSPSTRRHLLAELEKLADAFIPLAAAGRARPDNIPQE